jgi:hypothetical protein
MGDSAADRGSWPDWLGPSCTPEQRCFIVHVFVYTLPFTFRWHRLHQVPEHISWEAMNDLARHMELHRRIHGSTGVDAPWWLTLCLRGELFELGRLQYHRLRLGFGDGLGLWYPWDEAEARGSGWRRGDHCLGVHIPESGPLTPGACEESFSRARDLFPRAFPLPDGQQRRLATCFSWLLDDQLASWLAPQSNIVQFQRRFELVPGRVEADDEVVTFVFRRPVAKGGVDSDILASLPQETALERAVVAHVRAGGHWYERSGFFELSSS